MWLHRLIVGGLWLSIMLSGGCSNAELPSLSPDRIGESEWRQPLLVTGLSPNKYLAREGDRLGPAPGLVISIGGVGTSIETIGGSGIQVLLDGPLPVGSHDIVVDLPNGVVGRRNALRVMPSGTFDSGVVADGGERDSGEVPNDAGAEVDAGPDAGMDAGTGAGTDAGPPDVCGDRVLGPTELCDDGNTGSGDGCSADCRTETSTDACPGIPIRIELGGPQFYRGSTVGASFSHRCGNGIGAGPDVVYEIDPTYTGWFNIELTPTSPYDAALMTRSRCPGSNQYFCADDNGVGALEVIDGTVRADRFYMILASSTGPSEMGDYIIRFEGRLDR